MSGGLSIEQSLDQRDLLDVLDELCTRLHVTRTDVLSRIRTKYVTKARHLFWSLLYGKGYSYPEIGRLVQRDHTTVMAGVKRVQPLVRVE